jgi:hypothetical protein
MHVPIMYELHYVALYLPGVIYCMEVKKNCTCQRELVALLRITLLQI